jgi:hypothetical protein
MPPHLILVMLNFASSVWPGREDNQWLLPKSKLPHDFRH